MTDKIRYLLLALICIIVPSLFITVFYYCRTEIGICPETEGILTDFRTYFDESKNEWVYLQSSAVIGEDLTAVRIDDFSELNVIDKVNYIPDEFIVPSSNPLSYDYQIVSLKNANFAKSGSIVIFLLNLDPMNSEFTQKADGLDKYKIGDYWKFSVLLPKIFTAANIYVNSTLVATCGEISDYEFIKYNTSDDKVTLNHVSETERNVLELEFYTRREAVDNNVITVHYQSDSETLAGLQDSVVIGSPDAVTAIKQHYPVTFLVALVVSVMIFFVLTVLSLLKKTVGFIAENTIMFGVMLLAVANYSLANVTGIPLLLSSLRYSASFVILFAASLMLSKKSSLLVRLPFVLLNVTGFVLSFILPYISLSAENAIIISVTVLKIISAAFVLCLIFLPLFKKTAFPSLLRILGAGIAAVNVVSSAFITPSLQVLQYPPIWLYFALTVVSFLTVFQIIANTEKENDSEQIKLINIVKQNNKRVLDNLNEIAGYAKLNYFAEASRPTDLKEICEKLYRYCSEDCKAAGILLKNTVDKKTLAFAKPQGLENALTNIILNAIEHADCTEITISMRSDKNKILLSIKDNGRGISPDLDVFRPYVSENKPDTGGLGLYICKTIIESMNGELSYYCNGGTAFTVALLKA